MSFFDKASARCFRKLSFETINVSPFESGGLLNPHCFCFNLKLAFIERYKVFSQLVCRFSAIEKREETKISYLSVWEDTRFFLGWGQAGHSTANDPALSALNFLVP